MSNGNSVHADMLAILAEVQADPRTSLFTKAARCKGLGRDELTGGEAFLIPAERELIRAHREGLERFLYSRADASLVASEWGQRALLNVDDPGRDAPGIGLARKCATALQMEQVLAELGEPIADLKLAIRLRSNSSARTLLGVAYSSRDAFGPAMEQLQMAYRGANNGQERGVVLLNLAAVAWTAESYASALELYQRAADLDPEDPRPAGMALAAALASRDSHLLGQAHAMLSRVSPEALESERLDILRIGKGKQILNQAGAVEWALAEVQSEFAQTVIKGMSQGSNDGK